MSLAERAIDWTEQGLVPDALVRAGIRRVLRERLAEIAPDDVEGAADRVAAFVQAMSGPVARLPQKANEQHYEVPAAFYACALGARRKYSACHFAVDSDTLDDAEEDALAITCAHASLRDGQRVLELGCGWGSLTLYMAEHYPQSAITAVSNSHSQREFIVAEAQRRGLRNVTVITTDMNGFECAERFDRIVSVEMFEHMRNWRELFARVGSWLAPGGRFLMHVFVHRSVPYLFESRGASDWMSEHFFSGGMMPSDDLALHFQHDVELVRRWRWNGTHYARTANAWLANLDANRERALAVLATAYGAEAAAQWLQRWRMFFMACAELFGHDRGREWFVSHYLFAPTGTRTR
jgi:cyclopropane-fatty-acyl-phospholipid synthase